MTTQRGGRFSRTQARRQRRERQQRRNGRATLPPAPAPEVDVELRRGYRLTVTLAPRRVTLHADERSVRAELHRAGAHRATHLSLPEPHQLLALAWRESYRAYGYTVRPCAVQVDGDGRIEAPGNVPDLGSNLSALERRST